MSTRRSFIREAVTAAAGALVLGHPVAGLARQAASGKRRQVTVGGRRVKTVDAHAHCVIPQVWDTIKDLQLGRALRTAQNGGLVNIAERLRQMDQQGIDVEVLTINPFWYPADRDLARRIIDIQNEGLAKLCAAQPDRFVALASVALQHP